MAYRNLVNIGSLTEAQVWRHVKDFLTSRNGIADYSASGLGWTLHDSSFAVNADTPTVGDWVVVSSAGEDGKQGLYYRIIYSTLANSILQTRAGLYWNAATDAWVIPFVNADQKAGLTSGTSFTLYIYGDLDGFCILVGSGTTWSARYFGLASGTMHDPTIATTTAAVTSGSNVVVPVDSVPASWVVGAWVFVRDQAKIERAAIAAVDGTNVTLATLANNYASGARIARDSVVLMTSGTGNLVNMFAQIGRNGSVVSTGLALSASSLVATANDADPDLMNNCHLCVPVPMTQSAGAIGYYGCLRNLYMVSVTGITAGNVYADDATGATYRALLIGSFMYLFLEV